MNMFIRLAGHVRFVLAAMLLAACGCSAAVAGDLFVSPSGNDTNDCASAASACKSIQAAINKAVAYDTVHVAAGEYPFTNSRIRIEKEGLRLVGDNSPFAAPYGNGPGEVPPGTVGNKAANAAVLKAATSEVSGGGTSGMIWVRNVKNVRVENLYIEVDGKETCISSFCIVKAKSKEGIVATGVVNGLELVNNYIKIVNGTSAIGISVNLAAGGDSSVPSSDETRASGQFVTLDGNVVEPSTSPTAAPKRAIALQNSTGVIRGNQVAATTQDMWIQGPTASTSNPAEQRVLKIEDNWYFGRLGLYLPGGTGFTEPVQIRNNHFVMSQTYGDDADTHQMRLMGSSTMGTIVEGNVFQGFRDKYSALWLANRPNVTIKNNTFEPQANSTDFRAIVVGNWAIQTGAPPAPLPFAVTIIGNTFSANGAPANNKGKAILFVDDNDADGTATAGSLQIGDGTLANANHFDAGIGWYVALDDRTCNGRDHSVASSGCNGSSSYAIGIGIKYNSGTNTASNSQKRPFKWDVNAAGNVFGGVFMGDMDEAQFDAA